MTRIAPAAPAATFVTSVAGALTYGLLALSTSDGIAPQWTLGLIGGFLGARLQPHIPETALCLLLGILVSTLAVFYLTSSFSRPGAPGQPATGMGAVSRLRQRYTQARVR